MSQSKRSYGTSTAKLFASLALLTIGAGASQAQSYRGDFNGHSYYITPAPATWHGAEAMANAIKSNNISGHLVAVNSAAENEFIAGKLDANNNHVGGILGVDTLGWIGLHRIAANTWEWSNGDAYDFADVGKNEKNYHNWAVLYTIQQPDDFGGGADYTLIHSEGQDNPVGGWDDAQELAPWATDSNRFYGIVEVAHCANVAATVTKNLTMSNTTTPASILLIATSSLPGSGSLSYNWTGIDASVLLSSRTTLNATFTPKAVGDYSFTATVVKPNGGCISIPFVINVAPAPQSNVASMKRELMNESATAAVKVYPNPACEVFFVEIPQTEDAATVSLMDIQGKVLASKTVAANESRKVSFDVSNNPTGIYVVEVLCGQQVFRTKLARQ